MANILGIKLSELSFAALNKKIDFFLNKETGTAYLVTPNPEIILEAHRDEELFYILNKADLAPADGFGLRLAGFLFGENIPRLTGADLTAALLKKATKEGKKIAVLNWRGGLSRANDIETALRQQWPKLDFLILDLSRSHPLSPETIEKINSFAPAILFCAFGFPYQEKVIYHNREKWPSVRLSLGIGGSFDFISGRVKRAPRIWRKIGLEWLWRLIKQPSRVRRIYRATFVFMGKILQARFINPFLYRPNVACLLYKKEPDEKSQRQIKILLVEREDDPGHWQLPQGGLDGETPRVAGRRELREETGAIDIEEKAVFKNVYRYKFGSGTSDSGLSYPENWDVQEAENKSKHQIEEQGIKTENLPQSACAYKYDYQGQKQSLFVAEFHGEDSDLKVNFWDHRAWKWVDAERLAEEVHPVRRAAAKIFLEKFKTIEELKI